MIKIAFITIVILALLGICYLTYILKDFDEDDNSF